MQVALKLGRNMSYKNNTFLMVKAQLSFALEKLSK